MYRKVNTGIIAVTKDWTDEDRELWEEFTDAGVEMTVIPEKDIAELVEEYKIGVPNYLMFNEGNFIAWSPNRVTLNQFRKACGVSV